MTAKISVATADDLERIKEIAVAAGMFSLDEVEFFDEMFAGFLNGSVEGHHWLVSQYARTRHFYSTIGYVEEARVREFYGPGDDKVIFWKSLL